MESENIPIPIYIIGLNYYEKLFKIGQMALNGLDK